MIKRIYTGRYYILRKQVRKAREKYYYTKYEGMGTEKECDDAYAVWARLRRDLKEAVIFEIPDPKDRKDLQMALIQDIRQSKIQFSVWKHMGTGIHYLQVHGWAPNRKRPEKDGSEPGPAQHSDAEEPETCYIKILEKDIPAGYYVQPLAQWSKSVFSLGPRLRQEVLAALQASVQALNDNSFQKL